VLNYFLLADRTNGHVYGTALCLSNLCKTASIGNYMAVSIEFFLDFITAILSEQSSESEVRQSAVRKTQ